MPDIHLAIPHAGGTLLLLDIVLVLAAATLLGMLARRLGHSAVVGYLLAGVMLGPGATNLITQNEAFPIIAEVGVALLLFTIGLEISWTTLRHSPTISMQLGLLQPIVTSVAITLLILATGLGMAGAVTIAMIVAISSTAVVLRVLTDRAELDSPHGRTALSILLVQDFVAVIFLLLLPDIAPVNDVTPPLIDVILSVVIGTLKLGIIVLSLVIGHRVIVRRLFHQAASGGEREMLALLSLTIALGAAGAGYMLELSPALGAFVAGLLIGDTEYSDQVHAEIGPLQTTMLVLFFAYIGMRVDLAWVVGNILWLPVLVVGTMACKALLTAVALRLGGHDIRQSLVVGVTVAQLGEFSLVLAEQATDTRLLGTDVYQAIVAVVICSLALTPATINAAVRWSFRAIAQEDRGDRERRRGPRDHAIVIGFGPAGEQVTSALLAAGLPVTVIELNPRLRTETLDITFVQGDGARAEVLTAAGIASARLLVVTVPEPIGARRTVAQARAMRSDLPILARGRYHRFVSRLTEAGATHVADEETLVGLALAGEIGHFDTTT